MDEQPQGSDKHVHPHAENQNLYQVEHTNKNKVGKRSFFKIRTLSECTSPKI